jgi:putative phage-type endonuclease
MLTGTGRTAGHAIELMDAAAPWDDRERWLDVRRGGVTASEIGVIMGFSPYQSAFSLYWEKRGMLPEEPDNPRMSLGRTLEPYVCDQFALRYPGLTLTQLGLAAHRERPWQMATCDRIASDALNGAAPFPAEAKTSSLSDGWGPDGSEQVPLAYRCQVLWQMDVLGADAGYIACLFLLTQDIRVYEIPRDDEDIAVLREHAQEFLRRVRDRDDPPVDGSSATRRALRYLTPPDEDAAPARLSPRLRLSYEAAVRDYRRAEARKNLMENRVRDALGEARYGVDARTGKKVVTRSVYPVKEHVRKATVVDKLIPARKSEPEGNGNG